MATIDRKRLHQVLELELEKFSHDHPKCYALYQRAKGCLLDGVPMNWMVRWAGGFPLFVKEAKGASFHLRGWQDISSISAWAIPVPWWGTRRKTDAEDPEAAR